TPTATVNGSTINVSATAGATIKLLNKQDNLLLDSKIADTNGKVEFVNLKNGTYDVKQVVSGKESAATMDLVVKVDLPTPINKVEHKKYLAGYPDGTFRPDQTLTRAEMASLISRLTSVEGNSPDSYKDVPLNHWAKNSIDQLAQQEIMSGYPNGTFAPEQPVTRAEMASIVAKWKQIPISSSQSVDFTDIQGHWAQNTIEAIKEAGWMSGYADGTFKPDQFITRAEAAAILNRVLKRGPLQGVTESSFTDVPESHWAFGQIEEAALDHYFIIGSNGAEVITK
ncbi:MAG TPA: S-layer homology domain-containing protein, partial [Bacillota bacterium]|nr:S-layer homology domain-containing protein [Bacillota bacterium]